MTHTNDAPVTVEQCDRDAAFSLWKWQGSLRSNDGRVIRYRQLLDRGEKDASGIVQAFARERLAALASAPAESEAVAFVRRVSEMVGDELDAHASVELRDAARAVIASAPAESNLQKMQIASAPAGDGVEMLDKMLHFMDRHDAAEHRAECAGAGSITADRASRTAANWHEKAQVAEARLRKFLSSAAPAPSLERDDVAAAIEEMPRAEWDAWVAEAKGSRMHSASVAATYRKADRILAAALARPRAAVGEREAIARLLYGWSPALHGDRCDAAMARGEPFGTFVYAGWDEVAPSLHDLYLTRADAILALQSPPAKVDEA